MVVTLSVIGGFIWAVFAIKKRKKVQVSTQQRRLLESVEEEEEEEVIDNIMHKKRKYCGLCTKSF